jgi:hypothetical protein
MKPYGDGGAGTLSAENMHEAGGVVETQRPVADEFLEQVRQQTHGKALEFTPHSDREASFFQIIGGGAKSWL